MLRKYDWLNNFVDEFKKQLTCNISGALEKGWVEWINNGFSMLLANGL
jgi:hypothetical protein